MNLQTMPINDLISRLTGYGVLYIQTGNERFHEYARDARAEIIRRMESL